jgi:hypothetical protein
VRQKEPISQEVLSTILASALDPERLPRSGDHPIFSIQRTILPSSQLIVTDGRTTVSVYNAGSGRNLELGTLVGSRDVGSFSLRLAHETQEGTWNLVEERSSGGGVVVLSYSSREAAARYVEEATEVDLASDFDPGAHFFGEHRAPRHP